MTRVLVVDDDATIRSVVAELLEDEGYVVDTAADGMQALERARAALPAAILLDLMMPVLDGWGFVDACRTQGLCVGVPVVIMTAAHGIQGLAERLQQGGVRAVLAKPFDALALIALLDHYAPLAA
jgi:two-component system chemotaxis response regulator CheY